MSIKVTWVAGEIQTVPVSWTSFSIEAEVPYDKTLSSASFILTHDDVGQTIYYNDLTMTARATELADDDEPIEEEDITYITRDDHSGVLPSSLQHENLAEPYLHEPKAHTHDADEVNITDSGDYFSGTEVETALQELGAVKHASGSDNQNLWETISSDYGSTSADSETDTLTVSGSGGIKTAVSGDTLTVGINDGAITEAKLDISNSPSDGQYLQYDSASGKPKWDTIEPWTVNNEFQESPNGVLTTFTVTGGSYTSGGIIVTLNGQILNTTQWTEVDPGAGTISFSTAPYSTDELRWHGAGAGSLGGSSTDELAKVSANDTTAGYLNGKLVAGSNITLTEGNDGANEILTIASTASGGAWEVIDSYTVSGSPVSRVTFSGINDSLYFCYELKLMIKNDHATDGAYGLLFFNDIEFTGEDDTKIKRQKYYATNTTWTLGREKTAYIFGCLQSTESYTIAEFSRPGGTDVYAKLESIHQSDTSGYPRAYISFSRYINIGATISKVAVVCFKVGTATETALMYEGTSIVLLGLKK